MYILRLVLMQMRCIATFLNIINVKILTIISHTHAGHCVMFSYSAVLRVLFGPSLYPQTEITSETPETHLNNNRGKHLVVQSIGRGDKSHCPPIVVGDSAQVHNRERPTIANGIQKCASVEKSQNS